MKRDSLQSDLGPDLGRLARFGANVSDSHSCFIFLPWQFASKIDGLRSGAADVGLGGADTLVLAGSHSLSKDILYGCVLPIDAGLIGWVAKHGRAIHVSPFDRSSSTLGVYSSDQDLKSFIGVPILIESDPPCYGVVACDSKKSFAFSKLQGKLLEELAEQVGCVIRRAAQNNTPNLSDDLSWESFLRVGSHLLATVGAEALQLLRVKTLNIPELEKAIGIGATLKLLSQVVRLIQQTVPPGTPICRLPNGDLLLAVDNMMVSFYESRFEALAGHCREQEHRVLLGYDRLPRSYAAASINSFEMLVNQSLGVFTLEPERILNEYRRA